MIESYYQISIETISKKQFITIVQQWKKAVVDLDRMLFKDASKEFDLNTHVGFGADGEEAEKLADFRNVRGVFEKNSTVVEILNHIERKEALGNRIIEKINEIKA